MRKILLFIKILLIPILAYSQSISELSKEFLLALDSTKKENKIMESKKISELFFLSDSISPTKGSNDLYNLTASSEKVKNNCFYLLMLNENLAIYLDKKLLNDSATFIRNKNIELLKNCEQTIYLKAINYLAKDLQIKKRFDEALELVTLLPKSYDNDEAASLSINIKSYITTFYLEANKFDDAIWWARNLLKDPIVEKNPYNKHNIYTDIVYIKMRIGELDSALYYMNEVRKKLDLIKTETAAGNYYNTRGILEKNRKNYKEALLCFDSAIVEYKKYNLTHLLRPPMVNIANTYLKMGKSEECIIAIKNVLTKFPYEKYYAELKSAYENLVDAYLLKGDYKSAYNENLVLEAINDSLNKKMFRNKINQKLLEFERAQRDADFLNAKNQLITAELNIEKANRLKLTLLSILLGLIILFFILFNYLKQKNKKLEHEIQLANVKIEQQLENSKNEFLRKLIEEKDNERIKIGADLHDRLGNLILLNSPENINNNTKQILEKVYSEVRSFSHELSNITLKHFGLNEAILELIEMVSKNKSIKTQLNVSGENPEFPKEIELNIYAIVQELISNILKHSNASELTININWNLPNQIIIIDNGKQYVEGSKKGLGLQSITKRLEFINGNIKRKFLNNQNNTIIEFKL